MSHSPIRAPKTVARYKPVGQRGYVSSVSIALSEPANSAVAYRVRIDAKFSGGLARVGALRTAPPNSRLAPSRVIAVASMPGVLEWQVVVTPVRPYSATDVGGTLKIDGCDDPGCAGVIPLGGSVLDSGGPVAGVYRHQAGSAAGSAIIPAGAEIDEFSAVATAAAGGGTITVTSPVFGALPTIPIPAGEEFGTEPKNLVGPVSIAFAGDLSGWFVAYRELGA